ncbi:T9SS type A sorting domain-containing protein [Chryseolinea soli]|uniref:T9SS C-terminal target domain-containing protein n=1 Tax=Chryseolinea soli TaxID=2321403 RepID=A0A385SS84_9BACT|nr:T9SS type A sorting domain-containing protein [Chryseolinea soli]AYB32520.1 T9SS C-terminal target domain-containing protein [Chryseolinea soli]
MKTRKLSPIIVILVAAWLQMCFTTTVNGQVWKQYDGVFAGGIANFARYGDVQFASSHNNGVYKSTDGGATWSVAFPDIQNAALYVTDTALLIGGSAVYSYNDVRKTLVQVGQSLPGAVKDFDQVHGKLFAVSSAGVYQYDAALKVWVAKNNGITDYDTYFTNDLASVDGALFCSMQTYGMYKSIDDGESWTAIYPGSGFFQLLCVKEHNGSLFCAGMYNLFISPDKGVSWTDAIHDLVGASAIISKIEFIDNTLFVASTAGTYKLNDGETSWTKIDDHVYEAFHYDGTNLFASDDRGLYRWNDGGKTFVLSNHGVTTATVNDVILFNNKLYAAADGGLYFRAPGQSEWTLAPELDGKIVMTFEKKGDRLFAGTSRGLYFTSAGAAYWTLADQGINPSYRIWKLDANADAVFAATDGGVFATYDNGDHWKWLDNSDVNDYQMRNLAANDTMLVAVNIRGLYKIRSDSTDWERVDFLYGKDISSVSIVEGEIYATVKDVAVYRSSDYGATWTPLAMDATTGMDLLKRGDHLYRVANTTAFYSPDGRDVWDGASEKNIPEATVLNCIREGDDGFYVGTTGKSIWFRPYLSNTDITSPVYEIGDSLIYDVPANTTLQHFKSNITLGYGTSFQFLKAGHPAGGITETTLVEENDKIKVIAEDALHVRTLRIAEKPVTATENAEHTFVEIYPVPTKGILFVKSPQPIRSCHVSNTVGENVLTPTLQNNTLDVSTLSGGLYFLTIVDQTNRKQMLRFVKD